MSNPEEKPKTLKSLKIRAMEAEINYLRKLNQQQKQKIEELKLVVKFNKDVDEVNHMNLHRLQKELLFKQDVSKGHETEKYQAWKVIVKILNTVGIDVLIPNAEAQLAFFKARDAGQHPTCIKLLRNFSEFGINLKCAKDLYEAKFRDWTKYPKEQAATQQPSPTVPLYDPPKVHEAFDGKFQPGDKVVCVDAVNAHERLEVGKTYEVETADNYRIKLKDGHPGQLWSPDRFKHAE